MKLGTKITVPGVDWTRSNKHLLLVLQKGCHFCSESAPFYQRLIRETANHHDVTVIAALPQKTDEAKSYLSELGVSIDQVAQASPSSLGAVGTPTLMFVDQSGTITRAWAGKLTPEREDEVLRSLQGN